MTPPEPTLDSANADRGMSSAVSLRLSTLQVRADFQRASRGPKAVTPGFILQMRMRRPDEADGIRVGYTCSKKVGNAVARNRAKRRLREVARLALPDLGRDGADYVLIGRKTATATLPFSQLQADFARAVAKLHGGSR